MSVNIGGEKTALKNMYWSSGVDGSLKGNIKENLPLFWSQVMMMMMMTAKVMVITLIFLFFFKTILLGRRPFKSREMECDRV